MLFGHEMCEQVNWQRENDGRVLLGADARQGLQIAELQSNEKGVEKNDVTYMYCTISRTDPMSTETSPNVVTE